MGLQEENALNRFNDYGRQGWIIRARGEVGCLGNKVMAVYI